MDNTVLDKSLEELLEDAPTEELPERPRRARSMTVLKLQVLAERIRKIERIKRELAANTYRVDSKRVARAILAIDQEEENDKF